jgi:cephalosporin-C deacetylase-like acetyl esterase
MDSNSLRLLATFLLALASTISSRAAESPTDDMAKHLAVLDTRVIKADDPNQPLGSMLARNVRARRDEANRRSTDSWRAIETRADWERFRDSRILALRESFGQSPPVPTDLKVRVTRTLEGAGYRIENLVFESRPGLLVTANLYLPAGDQTGRPMPGILICHSHHNPKAQSELQDMGVTWARLGCMVLVMDQLGHGERRQHPFRTADDYPGQFRVGRQDYYFRYNVGMQLHLIGDSLMGWMVWDLMRGVDLLLARPGIDKDKIILLGAVAGGGDPAAVTAALDPRIAAVVPFNFGGPQPETVYPLPADAEETFNYAGGGSWESTRNLRLSARDGFLPWAIVGSVAPRGLVYAHEFAWDRERDPVWKRLERIYELYDASGLLAATHGRGKLSGQPPESTHCNNIGPEHRRGIYTAFEKWLDISAPDADASERRPADDLICLTADVTRELKPRLAHELAAELGEMRAAAARQRLAALNPKERRRQLRQDWARVLGNVVPAGDPTVISSASQRVGDIRVERFALLAEPGIVVPVILLIPPHQSSERRPVVVAVAQHGKEAFLKERSAPIAELLSGGAAVCLPDLRGTGETRPESDSRGRSSAGTSLSSTELMLGQTLIGQRLSDLRAVLRHLQTHDELDATRIAVWGDSFATPNAADRRLDVPLDADDLPKLAEPLGGLLAMLGALFDDDIRAVYVRGSLVSLQSVLESSSCYVPHDAIIPGSLTVGDLSDIAAALAPRPLRLEGLVDGCNRRVPAEAAARSLMPTRQAYESAGAPERLQIETDDRPRETARWLLEHL